MNWVGYLKGMLIVDSICCSRGALMLSAKLFDLLLHPSDKNMVWDRFSFLYSVKGIF